MMPQSKTIPTPRAATIVAGTGGSCGTATATTTDVTCSIPLTSQAGNLAVIASAARSTMTFSGLCGATVVNRGNVPSSTAYLLTAENLGNCSEALSVLAAGSATATTFSLLAQVYSGAVLQSFQLAASSATAPDNPSLAPVVNVTVPGSMVVAFYYAIPQTVTFSSPIRTRFNLSGAVMVITDSVVSAVGPYQLPFYFTGTACAARWAVLLEPIVTTPPPPTGDIPAIVLAIQQWRIAAQRDKIYLMPPAQRAARLAELQALAQQLKAAQIAQMQ